MHYLLGLLSMLLFVVCGAVFVLSRTAAHEILAAIIGVCACVLLSASAIVEAVNKGKAR